MSKNKKDVLIISLIIAVVFIVVVIGILVLKNKKEKDYTIEADSNGGVIVRQRRFFIFNYFN